MNIRPTGAAAPASTRTPARGAGGAGFNVPEPSDTAAPAPIPSVGLDALLSLQEVETPADRNRRARRYADSMLELLAEIQRSVLGLQVDPNLLQRLAEIARHTPMAADPGLHATVMAVSVRAHVELARLDIARLDIAQLDTASLEMAAFTAGSP